MFIDTHCHLTFPQFTDLIDVLSRSQKENVKYLINVGTDLENIKKSFAILKEFDYIFYSLGIHPHHALEFSEEIYQQLKSFSKNKNVVAIGETGLDYHYQEPHPQAQKIIFRNLIKLAQELNLPLIIHCREAFAEVFEIIKEYKNLRGVFHCFSESLDSAKKVLDLGFYISFTANITFPKTDRLKEVVSWVPLEKIMLETDSPYLAPQIFRGRRNEPSYVVYVAQEIAKIKNIPLQKVSEVTSENAKKVFNIG